MSANLDKPSGESFPSECPDVAAALARQHRLLLWRVQKMAFWVLYDNAGYLIGLNLVAVAGIFVPMELVIHLAGALSPAFVAAAMVLWVVLVAGEATLIAALINEEECSYRHVVVGMANHGLSALGIATVLAALVGVTVTGVWFYTAKVLPLWPILGLILSGLCLSGGLAAVLSGVYALPALVYQRGTARRALRTSLVLAGKHPVLTTGLVVLLAAQSLLLATPPGILLLSTWPLVALLCSAYELLARHHAAEQDPDSSVHGPVLDKDDIYLNRGFKEFLFPWKG